MQGPFQVVRVVASALSQVGGVRQRLDRLRESVGPQPVSIALLNHRSPRIHSAECRAQYGRIVLKPGDKAPDFTLLDQNGQPFTLSKSLKQRKVWHFLYFYPKADTPGCTQQSCGLRDIVGQVGDTAIVGISPDPPE